MRNSVKNYLRIAAKIAQGRRLRKADLKKQFYLGAVAHRKDGAMRYAFNGTAQYRTPEIHCEVRLSKKLDVGATVYLARMTADGNMANSRPCDNCLRALKARGVKKIFYTINNNEYGVL